MPYSSVSPVLAKVCGVIRPPGQSGAADASGAASTAPVSAVIATIRPTVRDRLIELMRSGGRREGPADNQTRAHYTGLVWTGLAASRPVRRVRQHMASSWA